MKLESVLDINISFTKVKVIQKMKDLSAADLHLRIGYTFSRKKYVPSRVDRPRRVNYKKQDIFYPKSIIFAILKSI